MTIDLADTPECTVCGTCCFSTIREYIRVFGVDLERMDDRARAYTDFDGHRCYMRMEGGHCTALVIEPRANGASFTCAIYEQRPDCCRWLERGSGACRGERHEKHERPLIAVASLVRARAADRQSS